MVFFALLCTFSKIVFVLFWFYSNCALCADLSGRRSLGARYGAHRRSARAPISTRDPGPPSRLVSSHPVSADWGVRTHYRSNSKPAGTRQRLPEASPRIRPLKRVRFPPACWWQTEHRRKDDGRDADRSVVERRSIYTFLQQTRSLHPPDVRVSTPLSGESALYMEQIDGRTVY